MNNNSNEPIDYEEEMETCTWCGEKYSKDELVKEKDLGYLCNTCVNAIKSRGEKLYIEY